MSSEKEHVTSVSMLASGSLAAAKFIVGVMIGSLALISDALHSLIDFGATIVTWFAVRAGDKPPDAKHHYGHGKVESLAALGQSAMLFLLAGGVAVESATRLKEGVAPVAFSIVPFVVLGIEMVVNGWRALALKRVAEKTSSQALEGDALHFASDFIGSVPVLIGLALSAIGYGWADPAAALIVAAIIAFLGLRLARRTVQTLLDEAPRGVTEKIEAAIERLPGVVGIDRVRVRQVGPRHFVEIAARVPRTVPLDRLGDVKAAVHDAVAAIVSDADVTVTTAAVALDDETIQDRVMLIARNRALAVHHVTVQHLDDRMAVALDLEVDGSMGLGAAHEIATELEAAIAKELGDGVEVETHIEPLQTISIGGHDVEPARRDALQALLASLIGTDPTLSDVHNVRVREIDGGEVVIFHCRAAPETTVATVHEAVDALERLLRQTAPGVHRAIGHAEPRR